jgi:tetratricopeptide (TPR) repeat protein
VRVHRSYDVAVAPAPAVDDLLDRADAARAAGRGDDARALYDEAIALARAGDDLELWAYAALRAAESQVFGSEPGAIPVHLHPVYELVTDPTLRARLAAALARSWSYAGEPSRARPFGAEAASLAEGIADPVLLVDCLDAALVTRWGPDDLDARRELAVRLGDVAAHVAEPDQRLRAHLWAFQVACEMLDLPAMHRHLRAVERIGADSARARFFGATRRAMLDTLRGHLDTLPSLRRVAEAAADDAGLADGWMVIAGMDGFSAWMRGDAHTCASVAAMIEEFAIDEGLPGVHTEAALVWLGAGRPDRAAPLLAAITGPALADLPRDVNWLQTMQLALEVALAVEDVEAVAQVADLLGPYGDRAVLNAGAVMFHGVTDDPLSRAYAVLGDAESAAQCRERALRTYRRIGASWWHDRLTAHDDPDTVGSDSGGWTLSPQPGGTWLVGAEGRTTAVPATRGLAHLRELVRRPGTDVLALDLARGTSGPVEATDLGPVLDEQARAAYKRRLDELEAEIAEAEDWSDAGRLALLRDEHDALVTELAAATGLGGRRRVVGSSQERARVTVRKAIVAAIDKLDAIDPVLARHLRDRVRTGSACRYDPDPDRPVTWSLDASAVELHPHGGTTRLTT